VCDTVSPIARIWYLFFPHYPIDVKIIKAPIVVETDIQSRMAESFRRIAVNHPFEIQVFSEFQAAAGWVKEII